MIAIDPHKRSSTAAAVDGSLQLQTSIRVESNREGYRELRRFARRWSESRWAIEGAGGLGAPLATRLLADGLAVLEVPAKLAARVRALSTGHGRKTDEADAVSVGVAAWTATALVSVRFDETALALRALTEHRDDLVKARTQTVNRLHVLLAHLVAGGAGVGLSADAAAAMLRSVRRVDRPRQRRRHRPVDSRAGGSTPSGPCTLASTVPWVSASLEGDQTAEHRGSGGHQHGDPGAARDRLHIADYLIIADRAGHSDHPTASKGRQDGRRLIRPWPRSGTGGSGRGG